ncbi:unnamed protein product [Rhizoctonia solani]|uniref:NACHT domain-containing protein n=1 Tax=Rhizoctonia solani TaxID=456999 RepID=A0A8H2XAH8_9AGAM|nr:unnamed protein product [Rhizoctonia solani]
MTISDRLGHFQDRAKRLFRGRNLSSASLPNAPNSSSTLRSTPQVVVSPASGGLVNTLQPESTTTRSTVGPLSPTTHPEALVASTISLPNLAVDQARPQAVTSDPPVANVPETVSHPKEDMPGDKPLSHDETKPTGRAREVVWAGVKMAFSVLEASADAFAPLKSAIGGLNRCIEISEGVSKAREDYDRLQSEIESLIANLDKFKNDLVIDARTASIRNIISGIKEELNQVKRKQDRNTWDRHLEALEDSEDVIESYRRIEGHIKRLMLNASLNMWKTLDEEITDRRLHRLASSMLGIYNSAACDRTKRRECTEGTRVKELERLKKWVHEPSSSPIYWINGMAGTGKTTIVYTLCSELDTTDTLAASFFCTRLLPECRNVQLIIPSIARQLARFSRPFRHALSSALAKDDAANERALSVQFKTLIADPLDAVRHTLPPRVLVVIDALDECEDRDGIELLLDLLITSTSSLPIQLLMSSRPEPDIYRRMVKQVEGKSDAKLVLHELDPDEVQHDIEMYIRHELKDMTLTPKQWDGLMERCGVLFVYASTVCRYIESRHRMGSCEEAINEVLKLSLDGSGDAEKELDKLYTAILEAAFNRSVVSAEDRKRMKALLDTIICAQEPMTTEVLAGLLKLKNAEQASALLQPLFSVVNVAEDTRIAATLHASFPDFMLSQNRSASFYCAMTTHHIELTLICLKQISSNPVQFNICGIESSYLLDSDIADLPERANRAISPTLLYSCCHWTGHLELSGPSTELRDPVLDFLTARFLLWMEVLSLKKHLDSGSRSMEQIKKWCLLARMPKGVIELAYSGGSFLSFHRRCPSQSTAHIYTSMLPLWPAMSSISKQYIPRTTGMLRAQGIPISNQGLPNYSNTVIGGPIGAVCYYPSGPQLVAAAGNDIYMLDGMTGKTALGLLEGHTDLITSISVSPNGLYIASGSYDATIRVWEVQCSTPVACVINAHRDRVTSVAFSPDSMHIVSTGAYDAIRVWSIPRGEQVISINSTSEDPNCVRVAVFSTDGSLIISGDDNKQICFWNAHTGNLIFRLLTEHTAFISSIALSPNGAHLVSASEDGTMCIWDMESQQVMWGPMRVHSGRINQAIFSPNSQYIASCDSNEGSRIFDAKSGRLIATLSAQFDQSFNSIAFSPDSSYLASGTVEGDIDIWDVQRAVKFDIILRSNQEGIQSACFTSDGSKIVTGRRDGSIWLWDISDGELAMGPLIGHTGYICSLAVSHDGAYIASASSDKTIRLWDIKGTNGGHRVLELYTKQPDSLRFTPDGTQLLYGAAVYSFGPSPSTSGIAPSPNAGDARDGWSKRLPDNDVPCTVTSPDGLYVASGHRSGKVQMRHVKTGQFIIGPVRGHTLPVSQILFSPNGTHIVTCSLDDTIRFWPIPGKYICQGGGSADSSEGTGALTTTFHWDLNKDGWIVNVLGEHLAWLTPDLRPYLLLPNNDLLISHQGSFTVDFTGANIGELWTKSYQPL